MNIMRYGRTLSRCLTQPSQLTIKSATQGLWRQGQRSFHESTGRLIIKPVPLADIGEGIREVQIIQWFVEPEARVEQFQKLVEVQSDKASVEITAMYDGVIKKLHYNAEDVAQVGKPLYDMDIQQEILADDENFLSSDSREYGEPSQPHTATSIGLPSREKQGVAAEKYSEKQPEKKSRYASLTTPAVRGLLKEHNLNIEDILGTGKDGRVLKEDVHKHLASKDTLSDSSRRSHALTSTQAETPTSLTPIQSSMFKTMTRSLQTPRFLYADDINISALSNFRRRLVTHANSPKKVSSLAFIIKAVSLSLNKYPLLNARLDTEDVTKPKLWYRSHHNIGVAVDTPQGLLVPNIKNVGALSVMDITTEISRLSSLAKEGKLELSDLTGGTITISNVGSIGGNILAPVIVPGEIAILGIGKARSVPLFDDTGALVRAEMCSFSWSADHRIVDGATVARCSEVVRNYLEDVENMVLDLR